MNRDIPTDFAPPRTAASLAPSPRTQALRLRRVGFFVAAAACAVAGIGLRWVDPSHGSLAAGAFALLALCALGCLALPQRHAPLALTLLMGAIVLALAGSAVALGWGLFSPGLVVLGLLVFALGAANGWPAALGVAVLAALALWGLYAGPLPTQAAKPEAPDALAWLVVHGVAIAVGLAGGAMASAALSRRLLAAGERERRFRGLLALAADTYWEVDDQYRLVAAVVNDDESRQLTPAGGLGALPWESPRFICDSDTLDLLQANFDARSAFRDLPVGWLSRSGRERRFLISGEPRFGEGGVFSGFWGVGRDVSADAAASQAMLATETRYQELFSRIPTPLVLHRGGRMFDANPAALELFDQPDLKTLLSRDLLATYEAGDSRERARRRIEELEQMAPGNALPVTDFRLIVNSRQVWVRATGVRVEADGGPATLSIYVDDTERRAAEDAVRRSEAMLSHLVATSPDLITLSDMATGRYVMVNHAFERVTGHSATESVGRTALELGVWRQVHERERVVEQIQKLGSISDLPVTFVSKQGTDLSLLVSAARFNMDRREYMVINARDVTDSERARLEREAILANASVGIAVTRDRRFVLANRHFEQLFAWPAGEIIGQPGSTVWLSDEDYREVGATFGGALLRGEAVSFERQARRLDGSHFLARIHGRAVDPMRPAEGGTVWIVDDISERREFELALARARDDAEAASRAKSAFLANTSHELRTPLNGMIGLAQLAREPGLQPELRQQYLDQIAESAQGLAGVISDILDLSKIEAGKLQIETTHFDLGELFNSLHRAYARLAAARQLELHFDLAPEAQGPVFGDPLRVRQIVTNYLHNALKFTAGGRVTVLVRRLIEHESPGTGGAQVRIEVRDTGDGIPPEVQARLFKPFTQADDSTTRRFGGTGLGLSICHELATLMDGTVGVTSQTGQGSCFWAELPLPPASPLHSLPEEQAERSLVGSKVLMVEDNPVNMMIAVAMLERWGVQVTQAIDGRQAVVAVQAAAESGAPFDLVLMDVQMPVMGGHEATRSLRATAAGRQLPIIALTAAALVTERDAAMEAGMNDFLTKPVDADRLRSTLSRWARAPV